MIQEHTKRDIEKISFEILKGAKALDAFPTPIDKIVDYAELAIASHIDLSKIEHGFFSSFNEEAKSRFIDVLSSIRGILHRKEKVIYLDLSQMNSRKGFVKLHEVGHEVLPWQGKLLDCLDDDTTLDYDTQEEFEAEANYFASITLFQQDRFTSEVKNYSLGLEAIAAIGQHFGASFHATARRFVENSKKRCALLILQNISPKGTTASCTVRNYFQSTKFTETFGLLEWPETLGYTWNFVPAYYHGVKGFRKGTINLTTKNGEVEFLFDFFNNSYNAFVLLYPKGEAKKALTKIIVK